MTTAIAHSETREINQVIPGELRILARIEADLNQARRTGTLEDVFLNIEEIYSMSMHTEIDDVRARCETLLRAGAPTGVFS